nr:MAG TPA: hypothetical protein [Bacteriophage sp.]
MTHRGKNFLFIFFACPTSAARQLMYSFAVIVMPVSENVSTYSFVLSV